MTDVKNETESRISRLKKKFFDLFGSECACIVRSPGRTEICGNHCDHQNGRVIAASVDADIIAAAKASGDRTVHVVSEGHREVNISLENLNVRDEERGSSAALVRGIADALSKRGAALSGFRAVTDSLVPSGSGLSSSAAFENLITGIFLSLAGTGLPAEEMAAIGQYAENRYFGKPSGLMDQMASAVGGMVFIDFKNPTAPAVEKIDADPKDMGYRICIVNTGGSHADLTPEYEAIPREMKTIARFFKKEVLREVDEDLFYSSVPKLRRFAGDRAVLRAIHFFEENKRVLECRGALHEGDAEHFLDVIRRSGDSSWKLLQNIFPSGSVELQEQALALALSEKFLRGRGACRIHGGGFAGTIQAFVPLDMADEYMAEMTKYGFRVVL